MPARSIVTSDTKQEQKTPLQGLQKIMSTFQGLTPVNIPSHFLRREPEGQSSRTRIALPESVDLGKSQNSKLNQTMSKRQQASESEADSALPPTLQPRGILPLQPKPALAQTTKATQIR